MNTSSRSTYNWQQLIKPVVFLLCLAPFVQIAFAAYSDALGPDPAKRVVDESGIWALRLLWVCLAMTPLRLLTSQTVWIRYRRLFGLYALFYATVHMLSYVFLLFGAQWSELLTEITKRPYVIVGALAFVLLLPLGVTSTRAMQRRLGRRWVVLHRAIYAIAFLALVHFTWLKKLGLEATWPYAVILLLLLGMRVVKRFRG